MKRFLFVARLALLTAFTASAVFLLVCGASLVATGEVEWQFREAADFGGLAVGLLFSVVDAIESGLE